MDPSNSAVDQTRPRRLSLRLPPPQIECNSRLSGFPDVLLTFVNPQVMEDMAFHQCVRFARYEQDRSLPFPSPPSTRTAPCSSGNVSSPSLALTCVVVAPLPLIRAYTGHCRLCPLTVSLSWQSTAPRTATMSRSMSPQSSPSTRVCN